MKKINEKWKIRKIIVNINEEENRNNEEEENEKWRRSKQWNINIIIISSNMKK